MAGVIEFGELSLWMEFNELEIIGVVGGDIKVVGVPGLLRMGRKGFDDLELAECVGVEGIVEAYFLDWNYLVDMQINIMRVLVECS